MWFTPVKYTNLTKFIDFFYLACVFPYYMNLAAMTEDKIERLKFVITSTLSSFFWTATFLKPVY